MLTSPAPYTCEYLGYVCHAGHETRATASEYTPEIKPLLAWVAYILEIHDSL